MIVDIKFYEELALEMKKLKCSEMFIKADDVIELANRLREAEKDAARYRWMLDNCTTQQADSCGPIFVMTIRRNKNPNNVGLSIDEAMND